MVKRFVLVFAAVGFLLAVWDCGVLEFLPLRLPVVAANLLSVLVLEWPVGDFGWRVGHPLLLLGPFSATAYGLAGYVIARALRRLPSAAQDPHGHKMMNLIIICSAAAGLAIAVWYRQFLFAPVTSEPARRLLYHACISCEEGYGHDPGSGWAWARALLFWGPMNASFFGMIGWALGRAFRHLPPAAPETKPPSPTTATAT